MKNYVIVKNTETNLFWYGFGLGSLFKNVFFDIGFEEFQDVIESKATWYDLNDPKEKEYVVSNITDQHVIIFLQNEVSNG